MDINMAVKNGTKTTTKTSKKALKSNQFHYDESTQLLTLCIKAKYNKDGSKLSFYETCVTKKPYTKEDGTKSEWTQTEWTDENGNTVVLRKGGMDKYIPAVTSMEQENKELSAKNQALETQLAEMSNEFAEMKALLAQLVANK